MSATDWADELIEWANKNNVEQYRLVKDDNGDYWRGFPRDRETLLNITALDLSDNYLAELPESIGNLSNLTELDLGSNQLTKLPESIGKLTNLTELNLCQNQLTEADLPSSLLKRVNNGKLRVFFDQ